MVHLLGHGQLALISLVFYCMQLFMVFVDRYTRLENKSQLHPTLLFTVD